MADLDRDALRARGRHDPQRVLDRRGERLLDEDRDPALDRREGKRDVCDVVGAAITSGVEIGLLDHRQRLAEALGASSAAVAAATAASTRIRDGDELRSPGSDERTRRWFRPMDPRPASPTRTGRGHRETVSACTGSGAA